LDIFRNNLDLNFLRVFDALMQERSVRGAATRIGISSSAISHSLAKMRGQFGDELFVRTGAGMQPTSRALAMAENTREALVRVELAVSATGFVPLQSDRQFVIAANDYLSTMLLPRIGAQTRSIAPNIEFIIRPGTRIDLAEQIDLGRIDIAIAGFGLVPRRYDSVKLFCDRDLLVSCKNHPLVGKRIEVSDLVEFPLLAVSLGGQEEGAKEGFISERGLARRTEMFDRAALVTALSEIGKQARFALILPHFLAMPDILTESRLLGIVPAALAAHFEQTRQLAIHELPYADTPTPVQAIWHSRNDGDNAHRWLRSLLIDTASEIWSDR